MHFRIFHQPCKPNITKQHQTGFIIRHFLPEHPLVSFTSSWTAPIMTRPSKAETSANASGACPAFKSLRRRWTTTMAKKLHDSTIQFHCPWNTSYLILYYHGVACCLAINWANNLAINLWTLVCLLMSPKMLSCFKLTLTTRVQVRLIITLSNHSARLVKPGSSPRKCCQEDLTKGCYKLQRW